MGCELTSGQVRARVRDAAERLRLRALHGSPTGLPSRVLLADPALDRPEPSSGREHPGLERGLRQAERRGELVVHYQPIVSTLVGGLIGFEALLRWAHPSRGLVSPDLIIPIAERAGLINALGRWVLATACPHLNEWQEGYGDDDRASLELFVNVSAHQLAAPGFASQVGATLAEAGTDPRSVTLEVTESAFLNDSTPVRTALRDLKSVGVSLALDDFGTGYSSLNYLRQFPFDIVKIDRGFVGRLGAEAASDAIVASVIHLAHTLGMTVVAEGVETPAQQVQLAAMGCDCSQGFHFSPPVGDSAITALIQARAPHKRLQLPLVRLSTTGKVHDKR